MDASVLCPGPSLVEYIPERDDAALKVAVNRAAEYTACDWWAFRDPCSRKWTPKGSPRIFCPADPRLTWVPSGATFWNDTPMTAHENPSWWYGYTTLAAVWLAAWQGASRIRIHGADMAGEADYTGSTDVPLGARDSLRWEQERFFLSQAKAALADRGVTLCVP